MADDTTPTPTHPPVNRVTLTTLGAMVGIAAGSFGMYLSITDRSAIAQEKFEARIIEQVKKEGAVENRLTRLEERVQVLRAASNTPTPPVQIVTPVPAAQPVVAPSP